MTTQVDDLLGRPHEPLLCLGYVRLALARLVPGFRPSDLPASDVEASGWLDRHLDGTAEGAWVELGKTAYDATRPGDVVFGSSQPGEDFVAVLVDPAGGGFLTSTPERGSHIRMRRALKGVRSAQRRVQ